MCAKPINERLCLKHNKYNAAIISSVNIAFKSVRDATGYAKLDMHVTLYLVRPPAAPSSPGRANPFPLPPNINLPALCGGAGAIAGFGMILHGISASPENVFGQIYGSMWTIGGVQVILLGVIILITGNAFSGR